MATVSFSYVTVSVCEEQCVSDVLLPCVCVCVCFCGKTKAAFPEYDEQVGGVWQLAAANRKSGRRCQTQLIDESVREQPKRTHLLLSRSSDCQLTTEVGSLVGGLHPQIYLRISQKLACSRNSRLRPGSTAAASCSALRWGSLTSLTDSLCPIQRQEVSVS